MVKISSFLGVLKYNSVINWCLVAFFCNTLQNNVCRGVYHRLRL